MKKAPDKEAESEMLAQYDFSRCGRGQVSHVMTTMVTETAVVRWERYGNSPVKSGEGNWLAGLL